MKKIQMVVTSDNTSLFLLDFNEDTRELTFISSRNPQYKQVEKVIVNDDIVYTNLHYFHVSYLNNILKTSKP